MKTGFKLWMIWGLSLLLILPGAAFAQTEEAEPFNIEITVKQPPTECSTTGWRIDLASRVTTIPATMTLIMWQQHTYRYYAQYVNGDLNMVSYPWNDYSGYLETYAVQGGPDRYAEDITATYDVPLWTNTYQAVNEEYIVYNNQIIWETRTELDCEAGKVADYSVTSQAAQGNRADLPSDYKNLVVALEDIPRYRLEYTKQDYLGTINACQTFYISDIIHRRASFEVDALESLTNQRMIIDNGALPVPKIVDVADDYGQPGGQPLLDQCQGK